MVDWIVIFDVTEGSVKTFLFWGGVESNFASLLLEKKDIVTSMFYSTGGDVRELKSMLVEWSWDRAEAQVEKWLLTVEGDTILSVVFSLFYFCYML